MTLSAHKLSLHCLKLSNREDYNAGLNPEDLLGHCCEINDAQHRRNYVVYAKKWTQFWICLAVSSITFLVGVFFGWMGPTFTRILDPKSGILATTDDLYIITLMPTIGTFLGPIFLTYFVNSIGRKKTALITLFPYCFGNILIHNASTVNDFLLGELCLGFSVYSLTVVSVYIVEVASPHLRDTFGCFVILQATLGGLVGYLMACTFTIKTNSIVMMTLPLLVLVVIAWCPESPYYYLRKGDRNMARKAVGFFYKHNFVEKELNRLTKAVEHETMQNNGDFSELFKNLPDNRNFRALCLLVGLFFFQSFAGNAVILSYFPTLLQRSPPTIVSNSISGLIIAAAPMFMLFLSTFLMRFCEKKTLLVISTALTSLSMLTLTLFYFVNQSTFNQPSNIPMLAIVCFVSTNALGLANLPYVYFREIVPLNYVFKFTLIVDLLSPACIFLSILIFNDLSISFGYHFGFLICFLDLLAASFVFAKFLPKTKNRTLEKIQQQL